MFLRAFYICALVFSAIPAAAQQCSFTDWAWHSQQARAVNYREVVTTRDALTPEQSHPDLPCSVCREDQVEIRVGGTSTLICKVIAEEVNEALNRAVAEGFPISKIIGYRVGRTKGSLDQDGLRTQYSHHSFGLAIDVNPDQNGLYDRCLSFGENCRLRRGGAWHPSAPESITPQKPIYHYMRDAGLKWGGELRGRQKDFMHFSLGGD